MKQWKWLIAAGVLAVYLSGCQGNTNSASDAPAETTAAEAVQEEHKEKTQDDGADAQGGAEAQDGVMEAEDGKSAGEETSAADAEEIKMSNPMQEVSGPEALAEIGVAMGLPEDAEEVQCFIISQVVAEVNFDLEDTPYTYRGSATAEDFAGIFEEFEEEVHTVPGTEAMATDGDLIIKTTKSSGKLASWSKNGASYTLYTPAEVDEDTLVSLCQELIEKN